ncbi:hypothetical protein AU374_02410 [Cupriavidus metallidurans]|jgi:hypothetical protein|nr:hypothetical protein AU374_02410 [Cupriavidus metallidurans]
MTDLSVKYFTSGMTGAPQIANNWGDLVTMLDACLINGFALKAIDTLTFADGIATATISSGHAYRPFQVVEIAGAEQTEYNGQTVRPAIALVFIRKPFDPVRTVRRCLRQDVLQRDGILKLHAGGAHQGLKTQNQRHPGLGQIVVHVSIECRDELALLRVCQCQRGERSQIPLEGLRFDFLGERGVGFDALVDAHLGDQQEIGQPFQ